MPLSQGAYSEQRIVVCLGNSSCTSNARTPVPSLAGYCTSALYTGKLNGHVEVEDMICSIRDRLHQDKPGVMELVSKMGRSGVDSAMTCLHRYPSGSPTRSTQADGCWRQCIRLPAPDASAAGERIGGGHGKELLREHGLRVRYLGWRSFLLRNGSDAHRGLQLVG